MLMCTGFLAAAQMDTTFYKVYGAKCERDEAKYYRLLPSNVNIAKYTGETNYYYWPTHELKSVSTNQI